MTDTTDSKQLAERFSLPELRHEEHAAAMHLIPDQDDYGYWCWYADVVRGALMFKRANQPKPTAIPGHINIEAVRERADIVSIVEGYGIRLLKSGKNFKALCPFHSDKSPSFYIYPEEKRFHCYGCQADGDFIDFVMKLDNIGFKEAVTKC
jgi:hypothetical protein